MKIENNRTNKEVPFKELSIGDCFIYDDGCCYIKIDELCASPNAFNLKRDEIDTFKNGDLIVTSVKAKVVIE